MSDQKDADNIITMYVKVRQDSTVKADFCNWQAKLNAQIAAFPGFVSLEILSPHQAVGDSWVIVERFNSAESMKNWNNSTEHSELMTELAALAINQEFTEFTCGETKTINGVTEVFVTQVSPEKEQLYRQWIARMHLAEAKFPGFRGVYVQSPTHKQSHNWITLLQFDTPENLDKWLSSKERRAVLEESESMIESLESHRVISPYAGWFASATRADHAIPVWKQTMLVLLVLFPIVMLEFKFLAPFTADLDVSLATFIGNALSVSLISWPLMPLAILLLGWWLMPTKKRQLKVTLAGVIVVLILYLIEVIAFWSFV
jgi:uncharacterized protein